MTAVSTPSTPGAYALKVKACICCGAKLSPAIKHVETALGMLGPKCARKYDMKAAVDTLYGAGLGELVSGEIRLVGIPSDTGGFRFPQAEYDALCSRASACGVALSWRPDAPNRQFIVTLSGKSMGAFLARFGVGGGKA